MHHLTLTLTENTHMHTYTITYHLNWACTLHCTWYKNRKNYTLAEAHSRTNLHL